MQDPPPPPHPPRESNAGGSAGGLRPWQGLAGDAEGEAAAGASRRALGSWEELGGAGGCWGSGGGLSGCRACWFLSFAAFKGLASEDVVMAAEDHSQLCLLSGSIGHTKLLPCPPPPTRKAHRRISEGTTFSLPIASPAP